MALTSQRLLADFPAFFRVSEEVVVIVGGGEEALNKARLVAQTSARLRIIARELEPALASFIESHIKSHRAEHLSQSFSADLLEGAKLVLLPRVMKIGIARLQHRPRRRKFQSTLSTALRSVIS